MKSPFFDTTNLSLNQKRELIRWALEQDGADWWVDILDCSQSWYRQRIDMSLDDIIGKLDDKCHFVVVERSLPKKYLEIGFSTMTSPDYFLWINLDESFLEAMKNQLELLSD